MLDAPPASSRIEARGALSANIESAAFALRRDENAIVAALDHFGEVGVDLDHRAPALELRRAEILAPPQTVRHARIPRATE